CQKINYRQRANLTPVLTCTNRGLLRDTSAGSGGGISGAKRNPRNGELHMKNYRQTARIAGMAFLGLVVAISLAKLSSATGTINKGDLSGPWQVTLYGQGGCGVGTTQVNFTLNTGGVGTATSKSHSVGCGDATTTGNTFTITSI